GAAPTNVSADNMQGNSKVGRAVYKGHARLWQGESTKDADTIELQRDSRILIATGNGRGGVLQAPSPANASSPTKKTPQLWYIFASNLTYWDKENRAHLQKDVTVQSTDQKIRSSEMDIYFTRGNAPNGASSGAALGSQQISRAVGTGGVTVDQGQRRAT